jgi:hypothetical protein
MAEIDWNAEFEALAADRLEAETASARELALRGASIEREFQERGRKLSEHERLRQMAVRLCRQAGIKAVGRDAFQDRTKNQLLSIVREAEAVISRNAR